MVRHLSRSQKSWHLIDILVLDSVTLRLLFSLLSSVDDIDFSGSRTDFE